MEKPVSAVVPCHGWTPPGYPGNSGPYLGPCELTGGGEPCVGGPSGPCLAAVPASPYPSPPLSTHGPPTSGADLRWSPVSQLGADDSWPCGDLPAKNQLTSSLPVDLAGSSDVIGHWPRVAGQRLIFEAHTVQLGLRYCTQRRLESSFGGYNQTWVNYIYVYYN